MIVIKNSEELAKLVDGYKDLILKDEDVRIEFQVGEGELRDVVCRDLYLGNDNQMFDFNGGNFNGGNFKGRDFKGRDFNGRDFKGRDFKGRDFKGLDFNGQDVSYYAFFNCTGSITCKSIEGRREPHNPPVSLSGEINITG